MSTFMTSVHALSRASVPALLAAILVSAGPARAQSLAPAIRALDPPRVIEAGLPGFALYIQGSNFVRESVVRWDGIVKATTFVNSTLLRIEITEEDLREQGEVDVQVFNPSGERSNIAIFDIGVTLDPGKFDPPTVMAGSPVPIIVRVIGTGFAPGDLVNWNNQTDRNGNPIFKETTFISRTELRVRILPEDIAQGAPPSWPVLVFDSEGTFLVGDNATSANPVPIVTFTMPSSALAGDQGFSLSLRGSGFVRPVPDEGIAGTTVKWNGVELPPTIAGPDEILVAVQQADILLPGSATISVSNPPPGGGESTRPFAITESANFYLPRLITRRRTGGLADDSSYSGIAVVNLDPGRAVDLVFTAYTSAGITLSQPGVTNPAPMSLLSGRQRALVDTELFGTGLAAQDSTGWMRIESTQRRIAGFFLTFNESLTVLDGAELASSPLTSFVLPEIAAQGFTQVHIANPNAASANVTLDLLRSGGRSRTAPAVRTLVPFGSLAESLGELFPGAAPEASDYLRVTSNRGVAAFESFGRGAQYVAGLNAQNSLGGRVVLYSPQYVVGGAYRSTLSVVNLENTDATVTLELFGDTGAAIGTPQTRAIPGRGKIYVDSQDFFADSGAGTVQGYVKISSSGPRLAGSIVFGDPARTVFSTALPLSSTLHTDFVLSQLASDATYFTGVAILNPNEAPASVTIDVRDPDGVSIASRVEAIPARQRRVLVLTQFFPQLSGQDYSRGYIRITSDIGVVGYGVYGTHILSVLSAIPAQPVL